MVAQDTIAEVGFAEVGKIDEGDATEVVGHDECVFRHFARGGMAEVEVLDIFYGINGDGTLACFVDTCIYTAERIWLRAC